MGKKKNNKAIVPQTRTRLIVIDIMISLAMMFVVMGHLSVGQEPQWYTSGIHSWIYSFHMQLFLFLSAFLIKYTYKEIKSLLEYIKYIWRKFKKFFIWFIVIGLGVSLIACPKFGITFTGDYVWQSPRTLLLYPRNSEASFLWYIYVLFGYYLISPIVFKLPQWGRVLLCIASMFLAMLPASNFLATHDFCHYTFFYFLGVLSAEWIEEIRNLKGWKLGLSAIPFVAYTIWVFGSAMQYGFDHTHLGWWLIVTGTASIPFFYVVAKLLSRNAFLSKMATVISKNCYWIYLLQMFIIWGVVHAINLLFPQNPPPFWIFLIVTTILAMAIPTLLGHYFKAIIDRQRKKRDNCLSHPAKNTSLK